LELGSSTASRMKRANSESSRLCWLMMLRVPACLISQCDCEAAADSRYLKALREAVKYHSLLTQFVSGNVVTLSSTSYPRPLSRVGLGTV
jgi:hypothetical protein